LALRDAFHLSSANPRPLHELIMRDSDFTVSPVVVLKVPTHHPPTSLLCIAIPPLLFLGMRAGVLTRVHSRRHLLQFLTAVHSACHATRRTPGWPWMKRDWKSTLAPSPATSG
jgi:hypothetical protein